jgi:hypothetical protein
MSLIEIFLPTFANSGERFPAEAFDRVRRELTDRFGGVTAFVRSPAIGVWEDDSGRERRDEIVIFEVMVETLDRDWWRAYRAEIEARFRQDVVVVRAHEVERL